MRMKVGGEERIDQRRKTRSLEALAFELLCSSSVFLPHPLFIPQSPLKEDRFGVRLLIRPFE